MILIIYIIGCFIALGLVTYSAYKSYYYDMEDITVGTIIIIILCILASWLTVIGYSLGYIIDNSDKVIIKNNK